MRGVNILDYITQAFLALKEIASCINLKSNDGPFKIAHASSSGSPERTGSTCYTEGGSTGYGDSARRAIRKEKELLLYYIKPQESCIMSFSAGMKNEPSKIFAVAEEDTSALLLPTDKVALWVRDYPEVNHLFFQQYNLRYSDLLTTIHQLLFERMDKRLLDYLVNKSLLTGRNPIKISHRQIAAELGTAREVISRIMKKLENDGKVRQEANTIEIL